MDSLEREEEIIEEIADMCVDLIKDNESLQVKLEKESEEIKGEVIEGEKEEKVEEEVTIKIEEEEKETEKVLEKENEELKEKVKQMEKMIEEKDNIISQRDQRIVELEEELKKRVLDAPSTKQPPSLPPPPRRMSSRGDTTPSKKLISLFLNSKKKKKPGTIHLRVPQTREAKTERSLGKLKMCDLNEGLDHISSFKKKLVGNLRDSEDIANFSKAKDHHEKLRNLHFLESKMFEKKIKLFQKEEFKGMDREHEKEKEALRLKYQKMEEEFEINGNESLSQLKRRQTEEYNRTFKTLKKKAMKKPVKYSRRLRQLQRKMKILVVRREYVEADALRQEVKPMENKEIAAFYNELDRITNLKCQKLKKTHDTEVKHVKKRIREGLESIRRECKKEMELLVKSFKNHKRSLEQNHKKIFSDYETKMKTQMSVIERHYDKNMVDFNKLDLNKLMETSKNYKKKITLKKKKLSSSLPYSSKKKLTFSSEKKKKKKKKFKIIKKSEEEEEEEISPSKVEEIGSPQEEDKIELETPETDKEKEEEEEEEEGEQSSNEESVSKRLFEKVTPSPQARKKKESPSSSSETKRSRRNMRRRKYVKAKVRSHRRSNKRIIIKGDKQFGTPKRLLKERRRKGKNKKKKALSTMSYDEFVRSRVFSI